MLMIAITSSLSAQKVPKATPMRFFANIDDFYKDIPIPDYEIVHVRAKTIFGKETDFYNLLKYKNLTLSYKGIEKKYKPEEYPSLLFTILDSILVRYENKLPYAVMVEGPYCYYINPERTKIWFDEKGNVRFARDPETNYSENFISLGIGGEIKIINIKEFEKVLKEYELLSVYNRKKPKTKSVFVPIDYEEKHVLAFLETINLLNSKIRQGKKE